MLLGRKKGEPTADSSLPSLDGDGVPDVGKPKLPKVKSQEELAAEQAEADASTLQEVKNGLQWKLLPAGYNIPASTPTSSGMVHNDIWVSDDCEAAAIGRDWRPIVSLSDKLYTPDSFWKELSGGTPPHVAATASNGSSAMMMFAERIFAQDVESDCAGHIPRSKDFNNNEDFGNAWTDLRNSYPALAALYDEIYEEHVAPPMLAAWYQVDPEGYAGFQIERMARWAVFTHPNEDVTEQTDQAYFHYVEGFDFEGGEQAPAVLDPSNPDHEMWIDLWLELKSAIQAL